MNPITKLFSPRGLIIIGLSLALTACDSAPSTAIDKNAKSPTTLSLMNVSYDVTRDFYKAYNPTFVANYERDHPGSQITISQSHGGSTK